MRNNSKKFFFIIAFSVLIIILLLLILTINMLSNKKIVKKNTQNTYPINNNAINFNSKKSIQKEKKNEKEEKNNIQSKTDQNLTNNLNTNSTYLNNNTSTEINNEIKNLLLNSIDFTGVKDEEIPSDLLIDTQQSFNLRNNLPIENDQFMLDFDYKNDEFVINLKNNFSQDDFFIWLEKNYPGIKKEKFKFNNNLQKTINNSNDDQKNDTKKSINTTKEDKNQQTDIDFLIEFLKIIFNLPYQLTPTQSFTADSLINQLSPTPTKFDDFEKTKPPALINNYIYYSQSCKGINSQYCKLPLPGRVDCSEKRLPILATAGCGPTTVTMIIANLTNNKSITPEDIVKEYNPSELDCRGSSYLKAKSILKKYGLRTGNEIIAYPQGKGTIMNDNLAKQLKNYQNQGATFFTLARYRQRDGRYIGHYFWIVYVDEKNNIWSLDPYYGRFTVPYNQNTLYPVPDYEVIFPVYKI